MVQNPGPFSYLFQRFRVFDFGGRCPVRKQFPPWNGGPSLQLLPHHIRAQSAAVSVLAGREVASFVLVGFYCCQSVSRSRLP